MNDKPNDVAVPETRYEMEMITRGLREWMTSQLYQYLNGFELTRAEKGVVLEVVEYLRLAINRDRASLERAIHTRQAKKDNAVPETGPD